MDAENATAEAAETDDEFDDAFGDVTNPADPDYVPNESLDAETPIPQHVCQQFDIQIMHCTLLSPHAMIRTQ